MAELFENFVNDIDMSSLYKIALERKSWKAMKEGEAIGEERFAKLTQLLMNADRLDDLAKAASDADYRNALYQKNDL